MSFAAHSLYDRSGQRLYLTPDERKRFLEAAKLQPPEWRTFAEFLVFTGCRISEALSVRVRDFDFEDNRVSVETLKQRRRGVWRRIPLSESFIQLLDKTHHIRRHQCQKEGESRVWPRCRTTAYTRIKEIMKAACLEGPFANSKGLRHTFGIHAILRDVPITAVQKWMGHSRLQTTQIYLNALGEEEYSIASRMWAPHR